MKHQFTARELLLIVVAAVLAVGIFYYELVYKNVMSSIKKYDTAELVDTLTVAQSKAASEAQMKKVIEQETANPSTGKVVVYNNLANEVSQLGVILNGTAENVSITWSSPTLTDTTVRRQATISFSAGNYETARALIQSIANMPYKNCINNVSLSGNANTTDNVTTYTVSISLTFFETINGATSTEGLVTDTTTTTK